MSQRSPAVLFASASPDFGVRLFTHVQQRWPDHDWTVCVKGHETAWLPPGCPVVCVPRWQPGLAAARRLRRRRFDLSVVAWAGDRGYGRLKLLHLLTPARERHIYNENVDSFELLPRQKEPTWLKHIRWRFGRGGRPQAPSLGSALRRLYGATLGPVLGAIYLLAKHALWSLGLVRRARR